MRRNLVGCFVVAIAMPFQILAQGSTVLERKKVDCMPGVVEPDTAEWLRYPGFALGVSVALPKAYVLKTFDSQQIGAVEWDEWWRDDRPINVIAVSRGRPGSRNSGGVDTISSRCSLMANSGTIKVIFRETSSQQLGHPARTTYVSEAVWSEQNADEVVVIGRADSEAERLVHVAIARTIVVRSLVSRPK